MSRRPARATQADIRRALKAMEATGVRLMIDVLPDGTIRFIPYEPDAAKPEPPSDDREIVL